jgi:hypothetical protein
MSHRHTAWHIAEAELTAYAAGTLTPPLLWSTEAHLGACPGCRDRLTGLAGLAELPGLPAGTGLIGPGVVDAGWERLDAELDAPVPGPVERLLVALAVPEHTARLLAATPALRASWLGAVAVTLALAALLAQVADPVVFLVLTPLLPLLGVAASFGPGTDPTYEVTIVAPINSLRLLLLRCVAVLAVNTALAGVASLTMADQGLAVVGWFLPSLALTVLALLLTPRLGAMGAALAVGLGWAVLVVATDGLSAGGSAVFTGAGQLAVAATAALAAMALRRQVTAFDTTRRFTPPTLLRRHR